MTYQVIAGLQNEDAVLRAFADASVDFNPEILSSYLEAYPQYRNRLKGYVQTWLMSPRATESEIAEQEISDEEILRAQSKLMMVWKNATDALKTEDESEAARRLDEFAGEVGLRDLCSAVLESDDDQEDILVVEYLSPGLRDEPIWVRTRLAARIHCSLTALPGALTKLRAVHELHYSAKGKPEVASARTWAAAVRDLSVSDERKKELTREG